MMHTKKVAVFALLWACPAGAQEAPAQAETKPTQAEKPAAPAPAAPALEKKPAAAPAAPQADAPATTTAPKESLAAETKAAQAAPAEHKGEGLTEPPPPAHKVEDSPAEALQPIVSAEEAKAASAGGDVTTLSRKPLLGLGVGAPDTGSLPGRLRPAFGVPVVGPGDYAFEFHGYMTVPFRVGINERERPLTTQYATVFHSPPLVPDEYDRFEHTGVMPEPWVQLNFSYGNSKAVATVIIAARSVSNASGFFDPPTQLGINDAFITFKPGLGMDLEVDVGGFANRYGGMGEYDLGRYDTPIIARIGGVGETMRARVKVAPELTFLAEHGVMGQFNRAQLGVEPAGWNGFADPNVGTTFAHHGHLGLAHAQNGKLGLHYAHAFTRDDRTAPTLPDGTISVLGADVEGQFQHFGRLYLAGAYTSADRARTVSPVIRVLNAPGGPGLIREYFGPDSEGTGSLASFGGQYDLSIGELLRHPEPFSGYAPDVTVSLFGLTTSVGSDDADFDGVKKVKYGTELSYSALSWLAFSGRYDRVIADTDDDTQTFAVLSPRIILRTDYNSQDQVTFQYNHWMYGSGVAVRTGYPPREDLSIRPDENTFSMTANMWW